jgi:two-component system CheB/CheR fusion protein
MGEVENTRHGATDLVVIGSSAGGVEALSVLVSTLPGDFPAPVVLAQHLDPSRPSNLDAILKRRTTLPVEVVNTSSTLEPGKIYVVPSNHNVTINSHHVEVRENHNKRPHPSVDMLLSSAAKAFGEHLIAVILTGSGSDGAAGAVDVKSAGGTVIVQDPQTARYPSMPLALPPTVVDFEAAIDRIGPLLYDLLNGVSIPPLEAKTEDVQRSILEQVGRQASLDFHQYKSSTILRRIGRRMTVNHISTMQDYLEYLRTYPEEVGELVKAFLINVTQFFRDPNAYAYLKSEILPKLIAQARSHDRLLRFWTAGCASGEEPYSLAMLITDLLGTELNEWSVKIFATDLDDAAINFARRGLYAENLLKGVPDGYRDRYFEHANHGFRISKTLRQMIIFGQQDLSRSAPFPRIDLVMCRNVLIYFTPELQEYVLNQFAFSLSPNGYLFLGKAETVRPNQSHYELVNKHWKVYRCTGNALPVTRRPSSSDILSRRIEGPISNRSNMAPGKHLTEHEPSPPPVELGQLRRFNELLLRFLPIGVVVIDRSYHVLSANGAARRLLGLRDTSNELDFLHAVRGIPYPQVRNAIDEVFREKNTVNLSEVELAIPAGGNGLFIALSIALVQMEAGAPDQAAISVTNVTEQVQTRRRLEAIQAEQTQLMSELSTANKRLNDVNKELMEANEELQVANEELVLTQEELQASIEEFETTNEELQATNEELETNNEELQATNEELETTNDELRARTGELQELATLLESERVRLAEMVELAPFYMLVLRGPRLLVEAYNPRFARLLEGRLVQDYPLDEVFEVFWESGMTIVRLAHEAYLRDSIRTTTRVMTHVPKNQSGFEENYFVYTIVPTHDANGKVSGVIIYAVDETLQRTQEAEEERKKLRLIFENTRTALALYDAQTAELLMGSPRYLDIVARSHGLEHSKLVGRKWHELTFAATPGEIADLWNTALESHEPVRRPEVHLQFPQNEQETIWDWSLTPILDLEKEDIVRFMLASAIEVTDQTLARQEMEQLSLLKDDFLTLASHELRTPLSSILGNAQLLQRNIQRQMNVTRESVNGNGTAKSDVDEEVLMLERIIHQVRRMDKLVGEMMDITRMRAELFQLEKRQHVNIVELVRRVVEQDPINTRHKLNLHTDAQELFVTCDEIRVEQVLNNLLSNAIKYSPKGTPIEVGVESRPDNEPKEVVVWVRDKGPGINEKEQLNIFDRFYRTQNKKRVRVEGLGLGLYIAHEIIRQHGGQIWLESKPGEGSTFYFSLSLE